MWSQTSLVEPRWSQTETVIRHQIVAIAGRGQRTSASPSLDTQAVRCVCSRTMTLHDHDREAMSDERLPRWIVANAIGSARLDAPANKSSAMEAIVVYQAGSREGTTPPSRPVTRKKAGRLLGRVGPPGGLERGGGHRSAQPPSGCETVSKSVQSECIHGCAQRIQIRDREVWKAEAWDRERARPLRKKSSALQGGNGEGRTCGISVF